MEEKGLEVCDCFEVHEDLLKTVNDTMPEETELYDLAELFKVFGDSFQKNLNKSIIIRWKDDSDLHRILTVHKCFSKKIGTIIHIF